MLNYVQRCSKTSVAPILSGWTSEVADRSKISKRAKRGDSVGSLGLCHCATQINLVSEVGRSISPFLLAFFLFGFEGLLRGLPSIASLHLHCNSRFPAARIGRKELDNLDSRVVSAQRRQLGRAL